MGNQPQREPRAPSQWQSLRALERFISASVWGVCVLLVWAGIRAWTAGAGITMMIIALVVCVAAALSVPHLKYAAFKHVMSDNGSIDDEWRRFNSR